MLIDWTFLVAAIVVPSRNSFIGRLLILLPAAILYSFYEFKRQKFWSQRIALLPYYGIFIAGAIGQVVLVIYFWGALILSSLIAASFERKQMKHSSRFQQYLKDHASSEDLTNYYQIMRDEFQRKNELLKGQSSSSSTVQSVDKLKQCR